MSKTDLHLDWCSHQAAKFAVEHWHYSGCMPAGKTVKIGVWENKQFIGCVIFSRGGSPALGSPFGLDQTKLCELTRIALNSHDTAVSKIISLSTKMLKKANPGLRVIISFADPTQEHLGIIYQAGNWIYTGLSDQSGRKEYFINGEWIHWRTISARYGTGDVEVVAKYIPINTPMRLTARKHRYLYPLDNDMRKQIEPLAKPYPKRANEAIQDAPGVQPGEGGAEPTRSLESEVINGRP